MTGSGFVLCVPSAKSIVLPAIGMPVSVSVSTADTIAGSE